jgi:hypothetical protein
MRYLQSLLTLLLTVLAYKLMVTAFSLMNKPSDTALYGGTFLLVVSLVGTMTAVRLLWRKSEP